MHIEEARWIQKVLSRQPLENICSVLNIGSSTKYLRSVQQPFIEEIVFRPLSERGIKVIHTDIKNGDGVDLAGNLLDETFRDELRKSNFKMILCSNLLEHVPEPNKIIQLIIDIVPKDGFILITVPYKYPKHMDPIDTFFRPSIEDLLALCPETRVVEQKRISVGTVYDSFKKKPLKFLKTICRIMVPFYKHKGWVTAINRLAWIFKDREIICMFLQKI